MDSYSNYSKCVYITQSKFLLLIFQKLTHPFLLAIGNFVLKPFQKNVKLELIIVMVLFPLVFNSIQVWLYDIIFQFWVLDNILKLKPETVKEKEIDIESDYHKNETRESPALEIKDGKQEYLPPCDINSKLDTNTEASFNESNEMGSVSGAGAGAGVGFTPVKMQIQI